jgi:ribonuclease HI
MLLDPHAIHIYTDGSCYENPGGRSGCAAVVQFPEHLSRADEEIVDFGCAESSNNRMELMACIKAIQWIRENEPWPDVCRAIIVTDSTYVTDNITYRARSWKQNSWRNRHGEPKANDDLWDTLLKTRAKPKIRVDFVWGRGKQSEITKRVDGAAKRAASRGGFDTDRGYRPGGVSRSMVRDRGVAARFDANGQIVVVRPYVKKVMHKGELRISFNIFDESAGTYAGKFFAFAGKSLGAELHLGNGHRVRFGTDPKYPVMLERIEGVMLPKPVRRQT